MKYKLYIKNYKIYKDDIYLLPTIRLYLNDPLYTNENFSVEFHFLGFHVRLFFIKELIN